MFQRIVRLVFLSMVLGGFFLRGRCRIRNVATAAFTTTRIRSGIRYHKRPSFLVSSGRTFQSKADEIPSSVHKHEDKLVKMQKETSSANRTETSDTVDAQKRFLKHQQAVFDDMSSYFSSNEAIPEEVVPVMEELSRRIIGRLVQAKAESARAEEEESENEGGLPVVRVCDIGCGTGALIPFLFEAADENGFSLDVTAVDLSPRMIALATKKRDDEWIQSYPKHSASFITGDFVSLILGDDYKEGDGAENDETVPYRAQYDVVISNACFANFYDMNALLTAMTQCLHNDGMLFVTHPLGADFVQKLHEEDSSTVPHVLPSRPKMLEMAMFQPLELVDFVESMDISGDKSSCPVYFCSLHRTPHRRLQEVMRLRGKVDTGYGRGGKKLGFPTANLPSSLFQNALEHVSTGVYFGWVLIEADRSGDNAGRNTLHKAAVNVGYSPTFEGQENQEKIIEAHLILDEPMPDFYGETMRLLLVGFLRPEKKFESFPALMAAIKNDVKNAKSALDLEHFASFRQDPLFGDKSDQWIGSSGGDERASWEFQPFSTATQNVSPS
jgi:riboflavin kinase